MTPISKFLSSFHLVLEDVPIEDSIQEYYEQLVKELNKHNDIENPDLIIKKVNLLKKHHPQTIIHSLMVAKDVRVICSKIGLNEDVSNDLVLAAYLHDIGKLYLHRNILNLKGRNELLKIWEFNRESKCPKRNLQMIDKLTIQEVVNYKAALRKRPEEYFKEFDSWWKVHNLPLKYKRLTIMEYIRLHQKFTKSILESLGLSEDVVMFASTHHSWYYSKNQQQLIPKESIILEIADKFNAIAQTEGIRTYAKRKSRIEALIIIVEDILYSYKIKKDAFFKTRMFEKKILYALIQRYFPTEIDTYIKPRIDDILNKSRLNNINLSSKEKTKLFFDIENMINIINALLKINSLFMNINFKHYSDYKNHLRHILYLKNKKRELRIFSKFLKGHIKRMSSFSKSEYLKSI